MKIEPPSTRFVVVSGSSLAHPGGVDMPQPRSLRATIQYLQPREDDIFIQRLTALRQWQTPIKGHLDSWIAILNRIDEILARCIRAFPELFVTTSRLNRLNDTAKKSIHCILVECLRFVLLLLENNAGRGIFNSIEHVIVLLGAYDDDVAELAVRVLHALCRHTEMPFSNESFETNNFGSHAAKVREHLSTLAMGGSVAAELLRDEWFAQAREQSSTSRLAEDHGEVKMEVYTRQTTATQPTSTSSTTDAPSAQLAVSTLRSIQLSQDAVCDPPSTEAAARNALDQFDLAWAPANVTFELLTRIRNARASKDPQLQRRCVKRRLAAICALFECDGTDETLVERVVDGHAELMRDITQLALHPPAHLSVHLSFSHTLRRWREAAVDAARARAEVARLSTCVASSTTASGFDAMDTDESGRTASHDDAAVVEPAPASNSAAVVGTALMSLNGATGGGSVVDQAKASTEFRSDAIWALQLGAAVFDTWQDLAYPLAHLTLPLQPQQSHLLSLLHPGTVFETDLRVLSIQAIDAIIAHAADSMGAMGQCRERLCRHLGIQPDEAMLQPSNAEPLVVLQLGRDAVRFVSRFKPLHEQDWDSLSPYPRHFGAVPDGPGPDPTFLFDSTGEPTGSAQTNAESDSSSSRRATHIDANASAQGDGSHGGIGWDASLHERVRSISEDTHKSGDGDDETLSQSVSGEGGGMDLDEAGDQAEYSTKSADDGDADVTDHDSTDARARNDVSLAVAMTFGDATADLRSRRQGARMSSGMMHSDTTSETAGGSNAEAEDGAAGRVRTTRVVDGQRRTASAMECDDEEARSGAAFAMDGGLHGSFVQRRAQRMAHRFGTCPRPEWAESTEMAQAHALLSFLSPLVEQVVESTASLISHLLPILEHIIGLFKQLDTASQARRVRSTAVILAQQGGADVVEDQLVLRDGETVADIPMDASWLPPAYTQTVSRAAMLLETCAITSAEAHAAFSNVNTHHYLCTVLAAACQWHISLNARAVAQPLLEAQAYPWPSQAVNSLLDLTTTLWQLADGEGAAAESVTFPTSLPRELELGVPVMCSQPPALSAKAASAAGSADTDTESGQGGQSYCMAVLAVPPHIQNLMLLVFDALSGGLQSHDTAAAAAELLRPLDYTPPTVQPSNDSKDDEPVQDSKTEEEPAQGEAVPEQASTSANTPAAGEGTSSTAADEPAVLAVGTNKILPADSALTRAMKLMVMYPAAFGGGLYSTATGLLAEFITHDPSACNSVHESGLADTVLLSLVTGRTPPERRAIEKMPQVLGALCLTERAQLAVGRKFSVDRLLGSIFGTLLLPKLQGVSKPWRGTLESKWVKAYFKGEAPSFHTPADCVVNTAENVHIVWRSVTHAPPASSPSASSSNALPTDDRDVVVLPAGVTAAAAASTIDTAADRGLPSGLMAPDGSLYWHQVSAPLAPLEDVLTMRDWIDAAGTYATEMAFVETNASGAVNGVMGDTELFVEVGTSLAEIVNDNLPRWRPTLASVLQKTLLNILHHCESFAHLAKAHSTSWTEARDQLLHNMPPEPAGGEISAHLTTAGSSSTVDTSTRSFTAQQKRLQQLNQQLLHLARAQAFVSEYSESVAICFTSICGTLLQTDQAFIELLQEVVVVLPLAADCPELFRRSALLPPRAVPSPAEARPVGAAAAGPSDTPARAEGETAAQSTGTDASAAPHFQGDAAAYTLKESKLLFLRMLTVLYEATLAPAAVRLYRICYFTDQTIASAQETWQKELTAIQNQQARPGGQSTSSAPADDTRANAGDQGQGHNGMMQAGTSELGIAGLSAVGPDVAGLTDPPEDDDEAAVDAVLRRALRRSAGGAPRDIFESMADAASATATRPATRGVGMGMDGGDGLEASTAEPEAAAAADGDAEAAPHADSADRSGEGDGHSNRHYKEYLRSFRRAQDSAIRAVQRQLGGRRTELFKMIDKSLRCVRNPKDMIEFLLARVNLQCDLLAAVSDHIVPLSQEVGLPLARPAWNVEDSVRDAVAASVSQGQSVDGWQSRAGIRHGCPDGVIRRVPVVGVPAADDANAFAQVLGAVGPSFLYTRQNEALEQTVHLLQVFMHRFDNQLRNEQLPYRQSEEDRLAIQQWFTTLIGDPIDPKNPFSPLRRDRLNVLWKLSHVIRSQTWEAGESRLLATLRSTSFDQGRDQYDAVIDMNTVQPRLTPSVHPLSNHLYDDPDPNHPRTKVWINVQWLLASSLYNIQTLFSGLIWTYTSIAASVPSSDNSANSRELSYASGIFCRAVSEVMHSLLHASGLPALDQNYKPLPFESEPLRAKWVVPRKSFPSREQLQHLYETELSAHQLDPWTQTHCTFDPTTEQVRSQYSTEFVRTYYLCPTLQTVSTSMHSKRLDLSMLYQAGRDGLLQSMFDAITWCAARIFKASAAQATIRSATEDHDAVLQHRSKKSGRKTRSSSTSVYAVEALQKQWADIVRETQSTTAGRASSHDAVDSSSSSAQQYSADLVSQAKQLVFSLLHGRSGRPSLTTAHPAVLQEMVSAPNVMAMLGDVPPPVSAFVPPPGTVDTLEDPYERAVAQSVHELVFLFSPSIALILRNLCDPATATSSPAVPPPRTALPTTGHSWADVADNVSDDVQRPLGADAPPPQTGRRVSSSLSRYMRAGGSRGAELRRLSRSHHAQASDHQGSGSTATAAHAEPSTASERGGSGGATDTPAAGGNDADRSAPTAQRPANLAQSDLRISGLQSAIDSVMKAQHSPLILFFFARSAPLWSHEHVGLLPASLLHSVADILRAAVLIRYSSRFPQELAACYALLGRAEMPLSAGGLSELIGLGAVSPADSALQTRAKQMLARRAALQTSTLSDVGTSCLLPTARRGFMSSTFDAIVPAWPAGVDHPEAPPDSGDDDDDDDHDDEEDHLMDMDMGMDTCGMPLLRSQHPAAGLHAGAAEQHGEDAANMRRYMMENVNRVADMGFPRGAAYAALQAVDTIEDAVAFILEHPELHDLPDPPELQASQADNASTADVDVDVVSTSTPTATNPASTTGTATATGAATASTPASAAVSSTQASAPTTTVVSSMPASSTAASPATSAAAASTPAVSTALKVEEDEDPPMQAEELLQSLLVYHDDEASGNSLHEGVPLNLARLASVIYEHQMARRMELSFGLLEHSFGKIMLRLTENVAREPVHTNPPQHTSVPPASGSGSQQRALVSSQRNADWALRSSEGIALPKLEAQVAGAERGKLVYTAARVLIDNTQLQLAASRAKRSNDPDRAAESSSQQLARLTQSLFKSVISCFDELRDALYQYTILTEQHRASVSTSHAHSSSESSSSTNNMTPTEQATSSQAAMDEDDAADSARNAVREQAMQELSDRIHCLGDTATRWAHMLGIVAFADPSFRVVLGQYVCPITQTKASDGESSSVPEEGADEGRTVVGSILGLLSVALAIEPRTRLRTPSMAEYARDTQPPLANPARLSEPTREASDAHSANLRARASASASAIPQTEGPSSGIQDEQIMEDQDAIGQNVFASGFPSFVAPCLFVLDFLAQVLAPVDAVQLPILETASNAAGTEQEHKTVLNTLVRTLIAKTRSASLLSSQQLVAAVHVCIRTLRSFRANSEATHSSMSLLKHLLRRHDIAMEFVRADGIGACLSMRAASRFSGQTGLACSLARRILEDPETLRSKMRHDVLRRFSDLQRSKHATGSNDFPVHLAASVIDSETGKSHETKAVRLDKLLGALASMICRDAGIFCATFLEMVQRATPKERRHRAKDVVFVALVKNAAGVAPKQASPLSRQVLETSLTVDASSSNWATQPKDALPRTVLRSDADAYRLIVNTAPKSVQDRFATFSNAVPLMIMHALTGVFLDDLHREYKRRFMEDAVNGSGSSSTSGSGKGPGKPSAQDDNMSMNELTKPEASKYALTASRILQVMAELVHVHPCCPKFLTDLGEFDHPALASLLQSLRAHPKLFRRVQAVHRAPAPTAAYAFEVKHPTGRPQPARGDAALHEAPTMDTETAAVDADAGVGGHALEVPADVEESLRLPLRRSTSVSSQGSVISDAGSLAIPDDGSASPGTSLPHQYGSIPHPFLALLCIRVLACPYIPNSTDSEGSAEYNLADIVDIEGRAAVGTTRDLQMAMTASQLLTCLSPFPTQHTVGRHLVAALLVASEPKATVGTSAQSDSGLAESATGDQAMAAWRTPRTNIPPVFATARHRYGALAGIASVMKTQVVNRPDDVLTFAFLDLNGPFCLVQAMASVDLDHIDAAHTVNALLKPLNVLTAEAKLVRYHTHRLALKARLKRPASLSASITVADSASGSISGVNSTTTMTTSSAAATTQGPSSDTALAFSAAAAAPAQVRSVPLKRKRSGTRSGASDGQRSERRQRLSSSAADQSDDAHGTGSVAGQSGAASSTASTSAVDVSLSVQSPAPVSGSQSNVSQGTATPGLLTSHALSATTTIPAIATSASMLSPHARQHEGAHAVDMNMSLLASPAADRSMVADETRTMHVLSDPEDAYQQRQRDSDSDEDGVDSQDDVSRPEGRRMDQDDVDVGDLDTMMDRVIDDLNQDESEHFDSESDADADLDGEDDVLNMAQPPGLLFDDDSFESEDGEEGDDEEENVDDEDVERSVAGAGIPMNPLLRGERVGAVSSSDDEGGHMHGHAGPHGAGENSDDDLAEGDFELELADVDQIRETARRIARRDAQRMRRRDAQSESEPQDVASPGHNSAGTVTSDEESQQARTRGSAAGAQGRGRSGRRGRRRSMSGGTDREVVLDAVVDEATDRSSDVDAVHDLELLERHIIDADGAELSRIREEHDDSSVQGDDSQGESSDGDGTDGHDDEDDLGAEDGVSFMDDESAGDEFDEDTDSSGHESSSSGGYVLYADLGSSGSDDEWDEGRAGLDATADWHDVTANSSPVSSPRPGSAAGGGPSASHGIGVPGASNRVLQRIVDQSEALLRVADTSGVDAESGAAETSAAQAQRSALSAIDPIMRQDSHSSQASASDRLSRITNGQAAAHRRGSTPSTVGNHPAVHPAWLTNRPPSRAPASGEGSAGDARSAPQSLDHHVATITMTRPSAPSQDRPSGITILRNIGSDGAGASQWTTIARGHSGGPPPLRTGERRDIRLTSRRPPAPGGGFMISDPEHAQLASITRELFQRAFEASNWQSGARPQGGDHGARSGSSRRRGGSTSMRTNRASGGGERGLVNPSRRQGLPLQQLLAELASEFEGSINGQGGAGGRGGGNGPGGRTVSMAISHPLFGGPVPSGRTGAHGRDANRRAVAVAASAGGRLHVSRPRVHALQADPNCPAGNYLSTLTSLSGMTVSRISPSQTFANSLRTPIANALSLLAAPNASVDTATSSASGSASAAATTAASAASTAPQPAQTHTTSLTSTSTTDGTVPLATYWPLTTMEPIRAARLRTEMFERAHPAGPNHAGDTGGRGRSSRMAAGEGGRLGTGRLPNAGHPSVRQFIREAMGSLQQSVTGNVSIGAGHDDGGNATESAGASGGERLRSDRGTTGRLPGFAAPQRSEAGRANLGRVPPSNAGQQGVTAGSRPSTSTNASLSTTPAPGTVATPPVAASASASNVEASAIAVEGGAQLVTTAPISVQLASSTTATNTTAATTAVPGTASGGSVGAVAGQESAANPAAAIRLDEPPPGVDRDAYMALSFDLRQEVWLMHMPPAAAGSSAARAATPTATTTTTTITTSNVTAPTSNTAQSTATAAASQPHDDVRVSPTQTTSAAASTDPMPTPTPMPATSEFLEELLSVASSGFPRRPRTTVGVTPQDLCADPQRYLRNIQLHLLAGISIADQAEAVESTRNPLDPTCHGASRGGLNSLLGTPPWRGMDGPSGAADMDVQPTLSLVASLQRSTDGSGGGAGTGPFGELSRRARDIAESSLPIPPSFVFMRSSVDQGRDPAMDAQMNLLTRDQFMRLRRLREPAWAQEAGPWHQSMLAPPFGQQSEQDQQQQRQQQQQQRRPAEQQRGLDRSHEHGNRMQTDDNEAVDELDHAAPPASFDWLRMLTTMLAAGRRMHEHRQHDRTSGDLTREQLRHIGQLEARTLGNSLQSQLNDLALCSWRPSPEHSAQEYSSLPQRRLAAAQLGHLVGAVARAIPQHDEDEDSNAAISGLLTHLAAARPRWAEYVNWIHVNFRALQTEPVNFISMPAPFDMLTQPPLPPQMLAVALRSLYMYHTTRASAVQQLMHNFSRSDGGRAVATGLLLAALLDAPVHFTRRLSAPLPGIAAISAQNGAGGDQRSSPTGGRGSERARSSSVPRKTHSSRRRRKSSHGGQSRRQSHEHRGDAATASVQTPAPTSDNGRRKRRTSDAGQGLAAPIAKIQRTKAPQDEATSPPATSAAPASARLDAVTPVQDATLSSTHGTPAAALVTVRSPMYSAMMNAARLRGGGHVLEFPPGAIRGGFRRGASMMVHRHRPEGVQRGYLALTWSTSAPSARVGLMTAGPAAGGGSRESPATSAASVWPPPAVATHFLSLLRSLITDCPRAHAFVLENRPLAELAQYGIQLPPALVGSTTGVLSIVVRLLDLPLYHSSEQHLEKLISLLRALFAPLAAVARKRQALQVLVLARSQFAMALDTAIKLIEVGYTTDGVTPASIPAAFPPIDLGWRGDQSQATAPATPAADSHSQRGPHSAAIAALKVSLDMMYSRGFALPRAGVARLRALAKPGSPLAPSSAEMTALRSRLPESCPPDALILNCGFYITGLRAVSFDASAWEATSHIRAALAEVASLQVLESVVPDPGAAASVDVSTIRDALESRNPAVLLPPTLPMSTGNVGVAQDGEGDGNSISQDAEELQIKLPNLSDAELRSLSGALTRDSCNEMIFKWVMAVMHLLSVVPNNELRLHEQLHAVVDQLANTALYDLQALRSTIQNVQKSAASVMLPEMPSAAAAAAVPMTPAKATGQSGDAQHNQTDAAGSGTAAYQARRTRSKPTSLVRLLPPTPPIADTKLLRLMRSIALLKEPMDKSKPASVTTTSAAASVSESTTSASAMTLDATSATAATTTVTSEPTASAAAPGAPEAMVRSASDVSEPGVVAMDEDEADLVTPAPLLAADDEDDATAPSEVDVMRRVLREAGPLPTMITTPDTSSGTVTTTGMPSSQPPRKPNAAGATIDWSKLAGHWRLANRFSALWDELLHAVVEACDHEGISQAEDERDKQQADAQTASAAPATPANPRRQRPGQRGGAATPAARSAPHHAASRAAAGGPPGAPGAGEAGGSNTSAMSALLTRFVPLVRAFFVAHRMPNDDALVAYAKQAKAPTGASSAGEGVNTASAENAEYQPPAVIGPRPATAAGAGSVPSTATGGDSSSTRAASPLSPGLRPHAYTGPGNKTLLERPETVSEAMWQELMGVRARVYRFVTKAAVLLNAIVRRHPGFLSQEMSPLVAMQACRSYLDFDNKRVHFRQRIRARFRDYRRAQDAIQLTVSRKNVFEDSFEKLRFRSAEKMRGKLSITFAGEAGIDAGGLTREWFQVLARSIFNPNYGLFVPSADAPTFQPNPLAEMANHMANKYFHFIGRVIGKAIAEGFNFDAHFTRSFYKLMLNIPPSYKDLEAIDPTFYRSLRQILDNNIDEMYLGLNFVTDVEKFGQREEVELVPGGADMDVIEANKHEYVRLIAQRKLVTSIEPQLKSFLEGFYEIVPPELLCLFTETELELLISGLPTIDVDDLARNTEYVNYRPSDRVIQWFWKTLGSYSQEERAKFIQFVTGTSQVPLEGFKSLQGMRGPQKFQIHKVFSASHRLPSAHTCFNQLDLPEYSSEEELRERLAIALREGSEGFGFA